ncbi:VWD domain-containing protein [Streptodolium elevatio]|uniref:VWD domain-containing protein n=1 Tax=Streptodolium elevatio TaxID=3157996 RepID=A0ABV3DV46_9ACTN
MDKDKPAPPTAWSNVMAMLGPDGSVSEDMAMSAFATVFGPVPGGQVQSGSREDLTSGSAALRWVWKYWDGLTEEQHEAVSRLSGWDGPPQREGGAAAATDRRPSGSATPTALRTVRQPCPAAAVTDAPAVTARLRAWWPKLAAKIGVPGQVTFLTCQFSTPAPVEEGQPPPPANAAASSTGTVDERGPYCRINFYAPYNAPDRDDATRDELMIHELAHCAEGIILGNLADYGAQPPWVAEGLADWMAGKLSGHFASRSAPGKWTAYLTRQKRLLTEHSYEGLGFWWELDFRGVDVWTTGRAAVVASAKNGVARNEAAFAAALGAKRQLVLEGWPASYTREIARDPAWDIVGIGVTGDRVTLKNTVEVASSGQPVPFVSPAFDPNQTALNITAEVLRLSHGGGAQVFGRFGPGTIGDYVLSAHMGTIFCTLGSACECPKDTPGEGTSFERINRGRGVVAVSGGEYAAAVRITGQTLADFCGRPKTTPQPPQPPRPPGGGGSGAQGPRGGSTGDPHLVTFDRRHYDFQAAGEFTLAASQDDDLRVQVRQLPFPGWPDVTANSAVAAQVAGHRVSLTLDRFPGAVTVRVDGRPVTPGAQPAPLPGGGTLTRTGGGDHEQYTVLWPDETSLRAESIGGYGFQVHMALAEARKGRMQGLLGNADGSRANDLDMGGGRVLKASSAYAPLPFDDLYQTYADHWRIQQGQSLFEYGPGQSTATFTDRSFPRRPTDAATVPNHDAARDQCLAAGVVAPETLSGCTLDVALTGRAEFAEAAADQQQFLAETPDTGMPEPEPVEPPETTARLGPFSGDATCATATTWVARCDGTLTAALPTATIRFSVEGFKKMMFAAEPSADCRVRFAVFDESDDTPLLDAASICEVPNTEIDIEQETYTIRLSTTDPAAALGYAFLIGGTA